MKKIYFIVLALLLSGSVFADSLCPTPEQFKNNSVTYVENRGIPDAWSAFSDVAFDQDFNRGIRIDLYDRGLTPDSALTLAKFVQQKVNNVVEQKIFYGANPANSYFLICRYGNNDPASLQNGDDLFVFSHDFTHGKLSESDHTDAEKYALIHSQK